MAYFELTSNFGYLGLYKVGLTGETGVAITPAVKTVIENTVDAYVNGKLKRTFSSPYPPMVSEIAGKLSMWQIISRIAPGRDPSQPTDRDAARSYKKEADDMLMDVLQGNLYLYATDGTRTTISTKEGKYVKHGEAEETHVFAQEKLPEDWSPRESVYDNG